MARSEFLCERCDRRRGIHATGDGLRCDRCLMAGAADALDDDGGDA